MPAGDVSCVLLAIAAALAARIVVVTVRAVRGGNQLSSGGEARTCPPVDDQTRFLKIVDDMRRKEGDAT